MYKRMTLSVILLACVRFGFGANPDASVVTKSLSVAVETSGLGLRIGETHEIVVRVKYDGDQPLLQILGKLGEQFRVHVQPLDGQRSPRPGRVEQEYRSREARGVALISGSYFGSEPSILYAREGMTTASARQRYLESCDKKDVSFGIAQAYSSRARCVFGETTLRLPLRDYFTITESGKYKVTVEMLVEGVAYGRPVSVKSKPVVLEFR